MMLANTLASHDIFFDLPVALGGLKAPHVALDGVGDADLAMDSVGNPPNLLGGRVALGTLPLYFIGYGMQCAMKQPKRKGNYTFTFFLHPQFLCAFYEYTGKHQYY